MFGYSLWTAENVKLNIGEEQIMPSSTFDQQFEKMLNKNKMLGNDFEELRRQREKEGNKNSKTPEKPDKYNHTEKTCYNCKKKNKCEKFRKLTGNHKGYVSVTGKEVYYCENYIPVPKKSNELQMSKKRIESLIKEAKKSLR